MTSYPDVQATRVTETDSTPLHPRRWAAAVVMVIAALMDLIDGTIVNVALPTLQRDLHASATQVEWTVSAYLLAFAAASPRSAPRACCAPWPRARAG